jgi:hypothetical protein
MEGFADHATRREMSTTSETSYEINHLGIEGQLKQTNDSIAIT